MSRYSNESDKKALFLRRDAEDKLRKGSAPAGGRIPLDKQALSLLYEMASDPARSSDALGLLHELQVHQVELDLQREELENNEREMNRELALYKALFALTPTICLVTTSESRILEANPAASGLLNTGHSELMGRSLYDFFQQGSHKSWNSLLRKLKAGEEAATCDVLLGADGYNAVAMRLSGSFLPEGDLLLLGVENNEPVLNDSSAIRRAQ